MRVIYFLKKALAIAAILVVMYLVVGFFFWVYYTNTVMTDNWQGLMTSIQPVIDFFQPAMDLYSMAYDAFRELVNGSSQNQT